MLAGGSEFVGWAFGFAVACAAASAASSRIAPVIRDSRFMFPPESEQEYTGGPPHGRDLTHVAASENQCRVMVRAALASGHGRVFRIIGCRGACAKSKASAMLLARASRSVSGARPKRFSTNASIEANSYCVWET